MGPAMSVGLGVFLGPNPEQMLENHPAFGLVKLPVHFIRSLGLGVVSSPTEAEPWHGDVFGKKTKSIKAKLSGASVWVVKPPAS